MELVSWLEIDCTVSVQAMCSYLVHQDAVSAVLVIHIVSLHVDTALDMVRYSDQQVDSLGTTEHNMRRESVANMTNIPIILVAQSPRAPCSLVCN